MSIDLLVAGAMTIRLITGWNLRYLLFIGTVRTDEERGLWMLNVDLCYVGLGHSPFLAAGLNNLFSSCASRRTEIKCVQHST